MRLGRKLDRKKQDAITCHMTKVKYILAMVDHYTFTGRVSNAQIYTELGNKSPGFACSSLLASKYEGHGSQYEAEWKVTL